MHGNERESTWQKRAEGLIKKGRAYRVAADHICLVDDGGEKRDGIEHGGSCNASDPTYVICDPNGGHSTDPQSRRNDALPSDDDPHATAYRPIHPFDIDDTNQMIDISKEKMMDMNTNTAVEPTESLTMAYVLERIEAVRMDTAHLHEAIEALANTPCGAGPGDVAGQERAKALGDIVRCRETTNQQLLHLYEKMYDDLRNADRQQDKNDIRETMLTTVTNLTTLCDDMDELPHILEQLGSIFDTLRFIG